MNQTDLLEDLVGCKWDGGDIELGSDYPYANEINQINKQGVPSTNSTSCDYLKNCENGCANKGQVEMKDIRQPSDA
jgi:hypothetical protein